MRCVRGIVRKETYEEFNNRCIGSSADNGLVVCILQVQRRCSLVHLIMVLFLCDFAVPGRPVHGQVKENEDDQRQD